MKLKIKHSNISHRHSGDTFRELLGLWESNGLCELEQVEGIHHCWINDDILLYEEPTLDLYNQFPGSPKFTLFGNTVPNLPNSSPWIFWGRRPSLMERIKTEKLSYDNRDIKSMFLGKIENGVQQHKRMSLDWSNSIELFDMPVRGNYKYNQEEYLHLVRRSKYGLCLSGFGPKCNREIELMCMGTVPIMTPLVDLTYYNPLIENTHFIKVNHPSEIEDKINNISKKQWEDMSNNCIEWYEKNASTVGSFNTTCEILEKNNVL